MPVSPVTLTYDEYGAGGAGPVVLLHGFPLNGAMWDDLVPSLADRYHLIVPDLRGHGRTSAPPGPYEMADHAADVVALFDRLGVQRAAIVGLSMGGYISHQLLTRHPERIIAAVLADTMGRDDSAERRAARMGQAEVIRTQGLAEFANMVLPRMFSAAAYANRPELVDRFRRTITSQRPEAVEAALLGLASRPNMLAALSSVSIPTLVLVGSEDTATTPSDSRELAATIPDADLVILPGSGHMSCWEDPQGFNSAVRVFLDRTVSGAA